MREGTLDFRRTSLSAKGPSGRRGEASLVWRLCEEDHALEAG